MEKRAMTIIFRACAVAIAFIVITVPSHAQVLLNGGFETAGGIYTNAADPTHFTDAAANWVQFANGLRTNEIAARTGSYTLKCYGSGCYGTGWDGEGAYQVISNGVSPGATYVLSGYGMILSTDPLTNTSPTVTGQPFGLLQIGWRNSNNVPVGSSTSHNFYSTNGLDTWISGVVTATAPVGATMISVYVMELAPPGCSSSGSIFFDDISVADLNATIVTNLFIMTISKGNQICWPTQTNAAYQAQSSPNNVAWANVGTPLPGDGNTNCTFESGSFGQRFYRVLELQ